MVILQRSVIATLVGAAALVIVHAGCARDDACIGGSAASPARYEECQTLCDEGDRRACDLRSELEADLATLCNVRSNLAACKALCHGRLNSQSACQKLGAAH